MSMPTTTLAGKTVGRMGYGLMQLTWNPKAPSQETSFAAMKAAADAGCTAWSSATFYGNPGTPYANIELIAAFFKKYPEYKDKIALVIKGSADPEKHLKPNCNIEYLREELKKIKSILGDKEIAIFLPARIDLEIGVEKLFQNMKQLKDEGLFGEVGASEISAESLEIANKIVPIAIIEIEVSLWSYEPSIRSALAWSKEHAVPVFCYSPLGRGFITRTYKTPDDIPEGSFLRMSPRFQGEAFYDNLKLVDKLDEVAAKKGVTTSELALAWVIHLSPYTIPIPGSSQAKRVAENASAASITLSEDDLEGVNQILSSFDIKGGRYPDMAKGHLMQ